MKIIKGLEYTKQVMHNAIAHDLPTDAQLVPEQRSPPGQLPPVYILVMTSHGMQYPFGQLGSAALAVSPPSFLCPSSLLAGWAREAEKSLTWYKHYLATTENISVLSPFFSCWTQNITLYQLLGRKLTLSQPKLRHKHSCDDHEGYSGYTVTTVIIIPQYCNSYTVAYLWLSDLYIHKYCFTVCLIFIIHECDQISDY